MKITKIVPIVITALLVGSTAVASTTLMSTEVPINQEENQPVFVKITGTIESVDVKDDVSHYSVREGENITRLTVTADTSLYDNTGKKVELKNGDKVVAYTDANKPTILIYPPQYSPEVIIVETEEIGTAAVGSFDENLLDQNLLLKLNISEETELSSVSGKEVKKTELTKKDLLIFYTSTTRSIPAQTTPHKVVVLDQIDSDQGVSTNLIIDEIIANDFYEVDGTKMVPLRKLAEILDYKVDATETGAILFKGVQSYTLSFGEKAYGYNKAIRYFEMAPALLEPGKTYVPLQFIEELKTRN